MSKVTILIGSTPPIGGAKYGGHIERLLGIVNLEMHVLDGTTKSNIFEKEVMIPLRMLV